jgi:protein import protein ZIM17
MATNRRDDFSLEKHNNTKLSIVPGNHGGPCLKRTFTTPRTVSVSRSTTGCTDIQQRFFSPSRIATATESDSNTKKGSIPAVGGAPLEVKQLYEVSNEDLELVKSVSDLTLTGDYGESTSLSTSSRTEDEHEHADDHDPLANIPGAEKGGRKLAIVYTCKVCNTRSAQKFTQQAYDHGVVMCRCPGCDNYHLIADRLGYFEDSSAGGWDIEAFLKEKGESITTVTHDTVLEILDNNKNNT